MELRDIIFLIIAIAAWIYSNFRKLQQEAAKRAKKLAESQPRAVVAEVKPQQSPVIKANEQRVKKSFAHKDKVAYTVEDHTLIGAEGEKHRAGEFWKKHDESERMIAQKNYIEKSASKNLQQSLIDEIRSGKTDWRRAVILSEIIRPVYFK